MKKIKTLFKLDPETHMVTRDVLPGSEWVIEGEGIATEKFNGTCCLIKDGVLYKRYALKLKDKLVGSYKTGYIAKREDFKEAPEGFVICDDSNLERGNILGWLPVSQDNPEDQWHREGFENFCRSYEIIDGTYELVGPKIQANPYKLVQHELILHGSKILPDVPRDFDGLLNFFYVRGTVTCRLPYLEGIVWHHPDGRMVKIRYSDFGKTSREMLFGFLRPGLSFIVNDQPENINTKENK